MAYVHCDNVFKGRGIGYPKFFKCTKTSQEVKQLFREKTGTYNKINKHYLAEKHEDYNHGALKQLAYDEHESQEDIHGEP